MRTRNLSRSARLVAGAAAAALVLAACGSDDGDGGDGGDPGGNGDSALAGQEITIGVFNGWDEGIAASYLWGHIFEQEGATVTYEFGDPVFVFEGVANGNYDISFDAWLPSTHEDYWAQYGDQIEDLGAWFTEAPLTIAVNEDAPITSLTELADNADAFGNRLVGIEPGAGLTRITKDEVIPTYGLEGMEFLESSTQAMLSELQNATDAGDDVVVTLWRPHWAYAAYPIRDLEDPEGALGDPEKIHSFGRSGFAADFPEAAEWLQNFTLTSDQLLAIEDIMVVQNAASSDQEYADSIDQWVEANPDFVSQATGM
ncbi:MAG: glycine/betaine ABC transporter substrate-binding protein [Micromonosporaceae bacterium]|nr:glycine/betaine ABC transporter substrate-binding protein [Micromonosporaceae bacterium]